MDQNQTTNNDDLQTAIDNIANTTNIDPVFSDPVAAPSSVPEGDTGELSEPVGPFPEPKVEVPVPAPEPIAPVEPINVPEIIMPEQAVPAPEPIAPPAPAPEVAPMPEAPAEAPAEEKAPLNPDTKQIKESALRDLIPLIDKLNISPSQKFSMCRNIIEDLHDQSVLEQAYKAASEIPEETERAEALLYLVETIDKM